MSKISSLLDHLEYGPAPEDAKLAEQWIDAHDRKFGLFIGGNSVDASSHFVTYNPATGKELALIGKGKSEDVEAAVEAAEFGLESWRAMGCEGRAKVLYAIARQVQKHARLFAVLETLDNGKPIRETRDIDIPLVVRHFYYHAGIAKRLDVDYLGYDSIGVCGQIIPWNFPLLMLAWKIAPALAAGNTVILKPAEFTSLTSLLFAEICDRAGVPAGVVNIVSGDGETGRAIVEHPRIKKIAFTGSTEVGRLIRKSTAGQNKKLSLELGGKSPFIVFEDADLDSAVEGVVDAIWFNQGQVCCAGSRLLVQESVAEKLFAKIKRRMETLRVGDPLDKAVDLGAIVDKVQLERIVELVEQGVNEGATCFQCQHPLPTEGWFYPPTLLTNVEPASTVAQEEIFGPVLVAMTFRTHTEAVALANNTVYGLAASVWTQDIDTAHDIAAKVKAGTIWVNCTNQFDASAGFGGYRESGFGREGGPEGIFEYLQPKPSTRDQITTSQIAPLESGRLDRTHKLYIGGKQVRPDSGYSLELITNQGLEEVARGNRKDIRNAVESAESALIAWSGATAFNRAQILYNFAENFEAAQAQLLKTLTSIGYNDEDAQHEFNQSLSYILDVAAIADKNEGTVHQVPSRTLVYTRNEPIGVAAAICPDDRGLLGLLEFCLPLLAMGNTVVSVPSRKNPLSAVELYRVIEASDFPAGVWNLITGTNEELFPTLADHDGISVVWTTEEPMEVEARSVGNLKQTWCVDPIQRYDLREQIRKATQVKNIWVAYGA